MKIIFRTIKAIHRKKLDGVMSMDLVISPWLLFFHFILILIFIMVVFYGMAYYFFFSVVNQGAREAAINKDASKIETQIYNTSTKVLPEQARGVTLFSMSDIHIDQSDGEYVTTNGMYKVMLPGAHFFESLGGSPENWTIPIRVKLSYLREFE